MHSHHNIKKYIELGESIEIIKKPLVTEKIANMQDGKPKYAFEVSSDATKIDIKVAIKELYGVEVQSVNILNTREKFKFGKKRGMQIRKRSGKKAYITLKNEKDILDVTLTK